MQLGQFLDLREETQVAIVTDHFTQFVDPRAGVGDPRSRQDCPLRQFFQEFFPDETHSIDFYQIHRSDMVPFVLPCPTWARKFQQRACEWVRDNDELELTAGDALILMRSLAEPHETDAVLHEDEEEEDDWDEDYA